MASARLPKGHVFSALVHLSFKGKKKLELTDIDYILETAELYGGLPEKKKVFMYKTRDTSRIILNWKDEAKYWDQSLKKIGVIEKNNESRLEIWRSTSQLNGYISIIDEKKEIIDRIGRNLRSFSNNDMPPRSLSIMLQADPGSGKTLLAKSLADTFDLSFIRYDVTQMIHRDELLDLFDNIATYQANTKKKIIVFVDEINAILDGTHTYGAFLAPLEEGIYIRRGKYFTLKPCVWIFAGTKMDTKKLSSDEKLSDFISRMTLVEKIDYHSLKEISKNTNRLQQQARLEQVYLGTTLLKHHFPDIQEISYEVLMQFYYLEPETIPARKIRKMVASLRNVQYGRITRRNCVDWVDCDWTDVEKNKLDREQKMIKLLFR